VSAGDTLYGIARQHGVSRNDLARWNNIQDPNRIQPGQTLRLSEP
jgi:lipoprotein NlpD